MAHEIEIVNGRKRFIWAGETPWHEVTKDTDRNVTGKQLTPVQFMEHAGNDWETEKVQAYVDIQKVINQEEIDAAKKAKRKAPAPQIETVHTAVDAAALVRKTDGKLLDTVTADWEPVQNREAAEFFNDFVMAGEMEMETHGSLKEGTIVFFLAKLKSSVTLFKKDHVDGYLLFTNYHKYGYSTDVRLTATRVVCANTHAIAMDKQVENMVKFTHRRKFDPKVAKELVVASKQKLQLYKEQGEFLGSKKADADDIIEYFKTLLPGSNDKLRDMSKNAEICVKQILENQPGTDIAPGTWWQPYNALTFFFDHVVCKTADQRLKQSWYGSHKLLKDKGLELALDYANKS